jgi:putative membrane protein
VFLCADCCRNRCACGWLRRKEFPGQGETPLDLLKKRYALGEIGKDEFDRMKKDLES